MWLFVVYCVLFGLSICSDLLVVCCRLCSLSAFVGCCLLLYAYCVVCSLLYFVDVCCRMLVGVIWSLFDACGSSIYI